jgi:hypothetical protein
MIGKRVQIASPGYADNGKVGIIVAEGADIGCYRVQLDDEGMSWQWHISHLRPAVPLRVPTSTERAMIAYTRRCQQARIRAMRTGLLSAHESDGTRVLPIRYTVPNGFSL